MAGTRQLKVEIIGDASSALRAFQSTEKGAGGLGGKLKSVLGGVGVGGIAAAGTAAIAFGASSVKAFADAETQHAKLEAAFKKFPKLAGGNIKALDKLNASLARKTKFDDDATASGQAVLAGFNLTQGQIAKLTPLLQDYATKTGKDLPTAAQDLGKAILGQGRALKGIGIDFKDTGTQAGNFGQLVDGLKTKVGGFATKEGQTAAGKMAILKNQFGELQEKIGAKLLPVLLKLGDWLMTSGIPAIEATVTWIGHAIQSVREWWNSTEGAREKIGAAFKAIAKVGLAMKDALLGYYRFIVDKWLAAAEWIVRGAAKAFGWVPGIGGKLKKAAREVEEFRDKVNAALGGIKGNVNIDIKALGAKGAAKGAAALYGFDQGGIVPGRRGSPQLILAHGGETVLPTHKQPSSSVSSMTNNWTINHYGPDRGEIARDVLWNLGRVV